MNLHARHRDRTRGTQSGNAIAEFGPVLFILIVMIMIPLIDFFSFTGGVATVWFMADRCARGAGGSTSATDALNSVTSTSNQMISSFGSLSGVSATGGTTKLTLISMPVTSGSPTYTSIGNAGSAATPVSSSVVIDPANNIYEYQVTCTYGVLPIFNFASASVFSGVPFLGAPVSLQFTSAANVEHPYGLQR